MDEDFNVTDGLKMTRTVVEELFKHNAHVNGIIIRLTQLVQADARIEHVELAEAARKLHS